MLLNGPTLPGNGQMLSTTKKLEMVRRQSGNGWKWSGNGLK